MALPTPVKTWQFDVNQTITGVDSGEYARGGMLALKNSLKGFALNPWIVMDSGNTTAQGGDTWTTIADIVAGSGGTGSWIRLSQPAIAAGFEIVIGVDNTLGDTQRGYIVASYTGFTGGTMTTRPTAADQFYIGSNLDFPSTTAFWFSNIPVQHRLHVWHSTDGEATYWQFYQADVAEAGGAIMLPLLPASGWTTPHIAAAQYGGAAGLGQLVASAEVYTHLSGIRQTGGCTTEARISGQVLYADTGGQLSTLDNTYILTPIGFLVLAIGGNTEHGRLGSFVDAWITSQTLGDATTFPDNASRQFVMLKGGSANMVLPWNGTVIETA